jgi:hypothetical protein
VGAFEREQTGGPGCHQVPGALGSGVGAGVELEVEEHRRSMAGNQLPAAVR